MRDLPCNNDKKKCSIDALVFNQLEIAKEDPSFPSFLVEKEIESDR